MLLRDVGQRHRRRDRRASAEQDDRYGRNSPIVFSQIATNGDGRSYSHPLQRIMIIPFHLLIIPENRTLPLRPKEM